MPDAPPCPPRPRSADELPFERRPMVDWMGPIGLTITGVEALMSGIFGSYADKREVQGAFPLAEPFYDHAAGGGDFVLDYVADLGDGFASTYAVAYLLARKELAVGGHRLPRGRLLIMGGDQVYPTAKLDEYRNRLLGPYEAALPCVPEGEPPHVFAIPGNHDWYDGLTTFLRLFCQSREPLKPRWIGGWKTGQERSYFALKLPRDWWLWGIDVQLKSEFDKPQLEYFLRVAGRMAAEREATGREQRLVLVTGQPSWVHSGEEDPRVDPALPWPRRSIPPSDEFSRLAYFEREVVQASRARLAVVLSGDLHHYSRYALEQVPDADPRAARQRITCGGGGAYLFATHQLPERLALAEDKEAAKVVYRRRRTYPGPADSRRLSAGVLRLVWRSPGFTALLGVLYFLFAWILEGASLAHGGEAFSSRMAAWPHPGAALAELGGVLVVSPSASALVALVVGSLFAYAWAAGRAHRPWLPVLGLGNGLLHVFLALYLIASFAWLNERLPDVGPLDFEAGAAETIVLFLVEMMVVGGALGALLFASYLLLASALFTAHTNEVFSAQRIEDHKCFLRLVIRQDGELEIFPVGLDRVPRMHRWKVVEHAPVDAPWLEPEEALEPHLVEGPIVVR